MSVDEDDAVNDAEASSSETQVEYEISDDERTWGIFVHAAAFAGFIIPFGNILGPLVLWAIKKEESQFVDENGKQALNFQITWTIFLIISALSILVLVGFVLLPLVALAWVVLVVLAIIRASNNQVYDYPLTIEFIT